MDFVNQYWTEICGFFGSRTFIVGTSIFFAYLFLTSILRKLKALTLLGLSILFGVFNPLKMRRIAFNAISLIFMVGGSAGASACKAKMNGSEGSLEAMFGGGCAIAIWGLVMLIFVNFQASREVKEIKQGDVK